MGADMCVQTLHWDYKYVILFEKINNEIVVTADVDGSDETQFIVKF